jgi:hypothetical protein
MLCRKLARLMCLQFRADHSNGEKSHLFSTMEAALNMIGPPGGDSQPPIQPLLESHRKTLADLLINLG